jgi:uracil phosphoribosyltransferase
MVSTLISNLEASFSSFYHYPSTSYLDPVPASYVITNPQTQTLHHLYALQPNRKSLPPTFPPTSKPNPIQELTRKKALNDLLPTPVPVYHLGLFREKATLQPVEYYNNLPFHRSELSPASPASLNQGTNSAAASLAVLLDPVIATGATAEAAILLLREWGVKKVIMLSVLASEEGVKRAAGTWPEGVEVWAGAVDQGVNEKGMIVPGLGDIGDRLFVAIGK